MCDEALKHCYATTVPSLVRIRSILHRARAAAAAAASPPSTPPFQTTRFVSIILFILEREALICLRARRWRHSLGRLPRVRTRPKMDILGSLLRFHSHATCNYVYISAGPNTRPRRYSIHTAYRHFDYVGVYALCRGMLRTKRDGQRTRQKEK